MVWHYTKKDKELTGLLNLNNFDLWRYNPKTKRYDDLCLSPNAEKLDVNRANPSTLEGLEVIAPNLDKIAVTWCKNMTDIDVLDELKNINSAYVNNERIIS